MLSRFQLKTLREEPLGDRPNKLTRARHLAGVTQIETAAGTGIPQTHISRIELGKSPGLPVKQARKLARFLGCAIEDIFPASDDEQAA